MSAPIVLGIALTGRQVGLVVLSLERLEHHSVLSIREPEGTPRAQRAIEAILRNHQPTRAAIALPEGCYAERLLDAIQRLLADVPSMVAPIARLKSEAKRLGHPTTNRLRARAYALRYPSLRERVPELPPLRAIRTPFEQHHEVVFRALLAADLALIDHLSPELPMTYVHAPIDPT